MATRPKKTTRRPTTSPSGDRRKNSEIRIIGGRFRGSRLLYSGRFETRPMKDRVREATFNLLGPSIKGMHAIDLFAGTGAIGLEAISRGAVSATLIERHVPTARIIRENVARLQAEDQVQVLTANTMIWARRDLDDLPQDIAWVVFCSPPYDFYLDRQEEILALLNRLWDAAPRESVLVVEADERFDYQLLPQPESWNVRQYLPAVIGILRDPDEEPGEP
jgi:16S rRNA (guanine966-N2)-methyltransferase